MAKPDRKAATPSMPRDTRLLIELIHAGQAAILRTVLGRKRFSQPEVINGEDPGGDWLLRVAARRGDLKSLGILLAAGADPNRRASASTGYCALWEAEDYHHPQVVNALLAAGATNFDRARNQPKRVHASTTYEHGPGPLHQ